MKRNYLIYLLGLLVALSTPLIANATQPADFTVSEVVDREPTSNIPLPNFISKGEVILGLTAAYGTVATDNTSMLYLLSGIDASLSYGSLDPFIGYFYRDNRCIGFRLGYSTMAGTLDSGSLDFGETNDLEFDIPYVDFQSSSFNYSVFHRNYLALDKKGAFGLFAETELMASDGQSVTSYDMGGDEQHINNRSFQLNLSFNPGIVVFVLDNVSTNVSFGMGGLKYTRITQTDELGNQSGSRATSQMRFKFNITDINFGITVHL
ncbi:MAG: hypothetical protein R3Y44_07980 [Rikenellaceae bacterium]